MTAVKLHIDF